MPATHPIDHVLATKTVLRSQVEELLSTVGDDPARFLADQGIRGSVSASCACPLARWLRRDLEELLGVPVIVVVGSERITVRAGSIVSPQIPLPPALARFVRDFDEGLHSRLVG